jgi:hypothetical protein
MKDRIYVVPNQRIVQIHKIGNGTDYKAQKEAYKVLGSNASKLYSHLVAHSNGFILALSRADAVTNANLTVKTYRTAVKELIEKGFLVEGAIMIGTELTENNTFHFYEKPPKKEQSSPKKNTNPRGIETTKIPLPEDYIKLLQSVDPDKLIADAERERREEQERLALKKRMEEAEARYAQKPYLSKAEREKAVRESTTEWF